MDTCFRAREKHKICKPPRGCQRNRAPRRCLHARSVLAPRSRAFSKMPVSREESRNFERENWLRGPGDAMKFKDILHPRPSSFKLRHHESGIRIAFSCSPHRLPKAITTTQSAGSREVAPRIGAEKCKQPIVFLNFRSRAVKPQGLKFKPQGLPPVPQERSCTQGAPPASEMLETYYVSTIPASEMLET